ncbi:peptidoglycan-binding protein [Cellvibrio japonicus]|uniref:Chitosanase Csn46F n=1 Tax=Cellvibrio japonicus (strain Ueda107) TaxID=498211 RepID=B3PI04_CELJU|nr:peptidoglycan-binding protein [Cellvibrio japonicus]ACE86152.1 Chitosanase Csn46F [Cellvibrio japonicus Ueda107]QEI13937.1 chitosanase [Cellvibrio japonicus]QEI17511.1 chitosanase [Cellvibrio japonicus]QEI21087.1 chitosanase [Cellvibrio japonicus]
MLTPTQKKTAEAIVNIFETGSVLGDYSNVTLITGDTGHLTFGRSQTTLGSGNLGKLLQLYCANPGARFRQQLTPFLARFAARDFSLDHEEHLKNILRATADDHIMRETQDLFFDQAYWQPAERAATQLGIKTPLGVAVVYDSTVHGSAKLIRDKTNQSAGTLASLGEQKWIEAYVATRRYWLANHPRKDLRPTVYRMDAFQRLIDLNLWGLELPLVVRGLEISNTTLNATPVNCYDGPQPGTRTLSVQAPLLRGLDIRLVQLGLSKSGINLRADGIFGNGSVSAVKTFQTKQNLPATGIVDNALIAKLVS